MAKNNKVSDRIWTLPNIVSMFRMLLAIPMVLLLRDAHANTPAILFLMALAYVSDLFDGYLAKHRGMSSQFGRIIDPLADKVLVTAMVVTMTMEHLLPLWFGLVVIARDVVIFLGGMYLRKRTGQLVQSNTAGKAAVVSIGLVLIAAVFELNAGSTLLTMMMLVSLGLITVSLYMYGQRFFTMLKQARR